MWDLWSVVCKWLQLLACAGVVGGCPGLLLARRPDLAESSALRRYVQASALLGLVAVPMFLLVQIGAVNRTGWMGMFDVELGRILLQSGLGQALQLRMLAFALILVALIVPPAVVLRTALCRWMGVMMALLAVMLLVASFVRTGHVSELSPWVQSMAALHVLAVLLWIGALYPLLWLSSAGSVAVVQGLMRDFGSMAVGIVMVLAVMGVGLVSQLLSSVDELWTTHYGRVLLLKLGGVGVLLLLAATNKLRFVPQLMQAGGLARLRWSIRVELAVAVLVLAATAWLTTLVGPAGV